jgi:hypothetical protein
MSDAMFQWAVGQGVAVAVLAWVLIRVDGRLTDLVARVDTLIALLTKQSVAGK